MTSSIRFSGVRSLQLSTPRFSKQRNTGSASPVKRLLLNGLKPNPFRPFPKRPQADVDIYERAWRNIGNSDLF